MGGSILSASDTCEKYPIQRAGTTVFNEEVFNDHISLWTGDHCSQYVKFCL